jgi:dUTPase
MSDDQTSDEGQQDPITSLVGLEGLESLLTGFGVSMHVAKGVKAPEPPLPGNVGYDLHAPKDIYLPHGCRREIDTGVILQTPVPLFMLMVPRSSMGTKRAHSVRICNTLGVIDPSFRGQTDTIKLHLERDQPKLKFVGNLVLDRPLKNKPLTAQAFDAFGAAMDATSKYVKVSDDGYGAYDVFTEVEEPDLIFKKDVGMVQAVFVPASRPELIPRLLKEIDAKSRGGFGTTD